jgi:hypothetical protein
LQCLQKGIDQGNIVDEHTLDTGAVQGGKALLVSVTDPPAGWLSAGGDPDLRAQRLQLFHK